AGAAQLFARASPNIRGAGLGLAALLVASFVILSNAQSATYADQFALYTATIERNPQCWMAHNNLGVWYKDRGDPEQAAAQYREAFRLKKDYAAAHINLGSALAKTPGRLGEAIDQFREALRIQPDLAAAHLNLGTALLKTPGRMNEAVAHYEEAVRLAPGDALAHASLGNALSNMPDRLGEAVAQLEEALRIRPDLAEAHNNLGLALDAQGRSAEAIEHYEEALRLAPGFAEIRLNIASALMRIPGREDEAAAQLEAFLRVRPDNEAARQILAQIRAGQR